MYRRNMAGKLKKVVMFMRLSQDLQLPVRAVLRILATGNLNAWTMKRRVNYGVRSPPKFMLRILNCSFTFSNSTLEFYSWINILHSSFKIHINFNVFLHLPFSFWTKLFYLTLFAVHFQPDKQIFTHCYFLLVLMPEPALYIWLRCEFCIRYSLPAFRQSPHQISNSTSYIFN